uniref:Ig-like domain-containing protein n=1 Tax=Yoonia maritima TaxID=1435347 RepID=UPI0037354758
APTGIDLTDATNTGATDDTLTSNATPTIAGVGEPGAVIEVFVGGVSVGTVTADPSTGAWEFPFAAGNLAAGDNAITTTATDAAGNTSAPSAASILTLDDAAPDSAPMVDVATASDSGTGEDNITNVPTPEIGGAVEPSSVVEIFVADVSVGTTTADEDGNWSFVFAAGDLVEGDNVVTATVTDTAGNTSAPSEPQTITVDTIAPTAVFDMPAGAQSGPFQATLAFSEPIDALSLAELVVENGAVSNLSTTDNVTFTFTVEPTEDGVVNVSVPTSVASDVAGNRNSAASSLLVPYDSTAPTVAITGPSDNVTETFTLTFDFSEDVTGFTIDDILVTGGTVSNFQGSGTSYTVDITPNLGEVVMVDIAGNAAQDIAGNGNVAAATFTVQSGSPAVEFAESEDEIRDIVVDVATRDLQNRLAANRQMVDDARTRFIANNRREKQCFTDETGYIQCPDGVGRRDVPLDITGDLKFQNGSLATRGSFFGQRGNDNGDVWRVISGNFNIVRDDDGSTSALISGRVAWEHETSDNTMLAYYVAGDVSRSEIAGQFNGTAEGYALTLGSYFVSALSENAFADGYASVGYGINNLALSNDTLGLEGEYSGLSFQTGLSLTGVYGDGNIEFWPHLSLDYGYSEIGTVDFDARAYGLFDEVSLEGGEVSIFKLSFEPEIKIAVTGEVEGQGSTTLTLTPRLVCQSLSGTTTTQECGGGAGISLSSRSADNLGHFNAGLAVDRVGETVQSNLHLKFERRF